MLNDELQPQVVLAFGLVTTKPRPFQPFGVIHRTADQILQAHRSTTSATPCFDGHVAIVDLVVKSEAVLESAAAAAGNVNPQLPGSVFFVSNQELKSCLLLLGKLLGSAV